MSKKSVVTTERSEDVFRAIVRILKREKEQDIKEYVAEVKRNKGDKYL